MPSGTSQNLLKQALPKQYFDVGIAEGHAVIFAAGLASKGFKPCVAIYSSFMQRAADMVMHDVCLQNLPVGKAEVLNAGTDDGEVCIWALGGAAMLVAKTLAARLERELGGRAPTLVNARFRKLLFNL